MTVATSGRSLPRKIADLTEADYFVKQNAVVDDFLKQISISDIAKRQGLDRASVTHLIDEWKDYVRSDKSFKEMGRERLHEMDRHYGLIISELWESHDSLKDAGEFAKAAAVAKIISEVEAKRQDALQKAGMYDDGELADMIMETERKTEAVGRLLMEIANENPELKKKILEGLKKIENPDYVAPADIVDGQHWQTVKVDD